MIGAGPRAAAALALVAATAASAQPATLPLPKPTGQVPVPSEVFVDRPERLKSTQVPGGVDDTERVEVLVAPDGVPAAVSMRQHLVLHGTGQFQVWERSSAQDVEALEDTLEPILKREAVIWQGFVAGSKDLVARLSLDPDVERELLPVGVEIRWRGAGRIEPGGTVPGAGEVTVRLTNRTARTSLLPTGEAAAKDLAGPLDTMLRYATSRSTAAPPMPGRGLPATLPATRVGEPRNVTTVAPFRVTGTIRVEGAPFVTGEGPGTRARADGLTVDGVLQGDAEFVVRPGGPGRLVLDLTAVPTLDPRALVPPQGKTWAEWLRRGPTPQQTKDALTTLVENAAAASRDDEYAPYLGHHGPGKVSTTFRYAMAPRELVKAAPRPLRPKPLPIALAAVALLGVVTNTTLVWRRL